MKLNERGSVSLVLVLVLALSAALVTLSLDFSGMLDQAFTMANSLWPIFMIPIALSLGIGIVSWVYDMVSKKFPH